MKHIVVNANCYCDKTRQLIKQVDKTRKKSSSTIALDITDEVEDLRIKNLHRWIIKGQINIDSIRNKFDMLWQYCQNSLLSRHFLD